MGGFLKYRYVEVGNGNDIIYIYIYFFIYLTYDMKSMALLLDVLFCF